jgi:hypothetical protein
MYKFRSIMVTEIEGEKMAHNYTSGPKKVAEKMAKLERWLEHELIETCKITVFDNEERRYRYEWSADLAHWVCYDAPEASIAPTIQTAA